MRSLLALVLAALPACSLLYDASSLGPGAETTDAGAPDAAEARGPRFCATSAPKPAFCADFDEGDVRDGWENARFTPDPLVSGGGAIAPEDEALRDGTRGVRFTVPPALGGANAGTAKLLKVLGAPRLFFIVELDARIATEASPGTNTVALFAADYGVGGDLGSVVVTRNGSETALVVFDRNTVFRRDVVPALPVGKWIGVRMILDTRASARAPGTGGTVKLFFDGARVAALDVPETYAGASVAAVVGPTAAKGPLDAFRMSVDNVRVLDE